ncbi:hypothetical protein ABB37_06922 [Leptomonas pyrrhocoris]|uniref:Transmembrane protein n=1 Tax=Leptomonas pyrrhocoris TaxID=157538 RepID=A0A0M9FWK4_LEPPY|nr:hypothetical protein ABB37_06922 [Leptomonas pyrrhocoris]KPA77545.1 hypothetical protein ABB37_06922 [Leptomonas pyrrhocoris]|eukprot:XP_015655984.1 hypothetical protein ABB37_06922 [Leptomonas pyrrhocoris]
MCVSVCVRATHLSRFLRVAVDHFFFFLLRLLSFYLFSFPVLFPFQSRRFIHVCPRSVLRSFFASPMLNVLPLSLFLSICCSLLSLNRGNNVAGQTERRRGSAPHATRSEVEWKASPLPCVDVQREKARGRRRKKTI